MADYALIIDSVFKEIRNYDSRPVDIPHKKIKWYPVLREYGDLFSGVIDDAYVIRKPAPSIVPISVTPRQVRLLLLQKNMLSNVEAMIAQQDEATRITWEYATAFYRDDPLLNQLALNLNLSQEELDQFFIEANEI